MASKCLKFVFIVSALMAIVFYGNLEMATPKNAQNLIKPSLSHNDFNKESQFTEVCLFNSLFRVDVKAQPYLK